MQAAGEHFFTFITYILFNILHACTKRSCNLRQVDKHCHLVMGTPSPIGTLVSQRGLSHTLFQQKKGK